MYKNTGSHLETVVFLYTSSGSEILFLEVCVEILGTTVLSDDAPLTNSSDFGSDLFLYWIFKKSSYLQWFSVQDPEYVEYYYYVEQAPNAGKREPSRRLKLTL